MTETTPVVVTSAQQRALRLYLDLLYGERERLNLTRVPEEQAWDRHIAESLSLLELRPFADDELVLDLGSGGGIPGIPLALMLPRVRFVLLERDRAKADFLTRCCQELDLRGVEVVVRDATELGRRPDRPRAQVVVSRAAATPPRLLPLLPPLMADRAQALLVVGRTAVVDPELRRRCQRLGLDPPRLIETQRIRVLTTGR